MAIRPTYVLPADTLAIMCFVALRWPCVVTVDELQALADELAALPATCRIRSKLPGCGLELCLEQARTQQACPVVIRQTDAGWTSDSAMGHRQVWTGILTEDVRAVVDRHLKQQLVPE